MIFVRSTIVWGMVLGILPLYMLLAYVLYLVNAKTRHKILTSWEFIFTFLARHICGIRHVVIGLEHLPKTAAIIASNHQSTWETFAYGAIFPQHTWILKRELIWLPVFGWTLRTASPIAINRANKIGAVQQILQQGVKRIAQGFWILVFPEGTRVSPSVVKPFKTGVARMALALQIPIVPVASNAGYCMPRASYLMFPGTITIIIDQPIYALVNESAEKLTARLETTIRQNLAKISR